MSAVTGANGRLTVRRAMTIDAPAARIWREFESQDAMRSWFLPDMDFEPEVGGRVELRGDKGGPVCFGGRILVFDPPRELTFEWGEVPPGMWLAPTLLTIRLTEGTGSTLVEILHYGFEDLGPNSQGIHASFDRGWNTRGLERLAARVAT